MTFDKIVQKQQILYYKSCLWRQNDFLFFFFKIQFVVIFKCFVQSLWCKPLVHFVTFLNTVARKKRSRNVFRGLEKAVTAPQHAISTLCKSQELEMQLSFRGCVPHFMFLKNVFLKNRRLPFCSLCIQVME